MNWKINKVKNLAFTGYNVDISQYLKTYFQIFKMKDRETSVLNIISASQSPSREWTLLDRWSSLSFCWVQTNRSRVHSLYLYSIALHQIWVCVCVRENNLVKYKGFFLLSYSSQKLMETNFLVNWAMSTSFLLPLYFTFWTLI